MKIFFIGQQNNNASPAVVNRELLKVLPADKYTAIYNGHGIRRRLSSYLNILRCDRMLISSIYISSSEVRLIRLLGKKIVYLMHGSYTMETGLKHPTEAMVLRYADKIVSVSDVHSRMIKDEFPQYADKVHTWFNGVDWSEIDSIRKNFDISERDKNKIILFGGGRHMKGNLEVCKAVNQLNEEKGLNLHVDVYGEYNDNDFSKQIAEIPCVNYKPLIPRERINHELAKGNLFIVNSSFETFSLALIDAIGVGCNVLFSQYVGAKDVINGKKESDIILEPNNIEELKNKIDFVLSHPNNERLNASIDREKTSWKSRASELDSIVSAV